MERVKVIQGAAARGRQSAIEAAYDHGGASVNNRLSRQDLVDAVVGSSTSTTSRSSTTIHATFRPDVAT
jgi:hypothetical protein